MKFVFMGYDHSLPTLKRLIKDGHEPLKIFTFPCDNVFNFNKKIIATAEKAGAPHSLEPITKDDIAELISQGAKCFLVCGYPHKVPPIDEGKAYALNVHPTYLPTARGRMPIPTIIIKNPEAGGFTVHKMTEEFDAGDILYQEHIRVNDTVTVDDYSKDVSEKCPAALSKVMANLPEYWNNAKPQDHEKATTAKTPTDATRTLHWHQNISQLDRILRAFGTFGCIAQINGRTYAIFEHKTEKENHDFPPGLVVDATEKTKKITAGRGEGEKGYITLKRFQII